MLTRRNLFTTAVVLALCTVAMTGCKRKSRKGTTINNSSSDIFTTDNFPGAPVQNGNVADDKRAFSPSSTDFNHNLRVTHNGDRGTAMCTYEVQEGGVQNQIYASYFDGEFWTPPVELSALDVDISSENGTDIGATIHAFINTSENGNSDAQERDGDCLIFWTRDDVDTGVAGDEENRCLFVTYFDVTHVEEPSARYGFQQFASRINSQDGDAEDVTDFGIVTDGLCGQASFGGNDPEYSYGNETTGIEVFWRQLEDNNGSTGSAEDAAPYTARFDLTTAIGADLPIPPSLETRFGVAAFASDAGVTSGQTGVDDEFLVYNNVLFWRSISNSVTAPGTSTGFDNMNTPAVTADDDVTIQFVSYTLSTSAITAPAHLALVTPVAADGDENDAEFLQQRDCASVYGSDEGLDNTVIFTVQLTEETSGFGDLTNGSHLEITTISDATGGIIENTGFGIDSVTDADHIFPDLVDTRISRNGDYIWVVYAQIFDLTAGADTFNGLRAVEYQTTRLPEDGIPIAPDAFATSLSGVLNIATPSAATGPVDIWQFQADLGYICGAQSDPDIMSVFYELSDGTSDTTFQAELTSSVIIAAPTAFISAFESYEDGQHHFGFGTIESEGGFGFNATDSGEDGFIFAAYQDDISGTSYEGRYFAERTGVTNPSAVTEIDSAVSFRSVGTFNDVTLISTPRGTEIGQYDPIDANDSENRPHGNGNVHVAFEEPEGTEDDGMADAVRTRVYHVGADSGTFGEDFSPNAGSGALFQLPFDLDLPFINPSDGANVQATAVSGDTVGVWYDELGHLYYQEYNDTNDNNEVGWRNIDGESDPALIDDDNDIELESVERFFTHNCVCDDLDGAMIFWTKVLDDNNFSVRLQVRVRDSGDNN